MESKELERDIDAITLLVRDRFSEVRIEQLKVTHPADDDGIWYFWMPGAERDDVQIESSYGVCPFLIETNRDGRRLNGNTVEETVSIICSHLETSLYE